MHYGNTCGIFKTCTKTLVPISDEEKKGLNKTFCGTKEKCENKNLS